MDLQQKAKSSKAKQHGNEGEDPDCCLTHPWVESDSPSVPKNDSKEQQNNPPSHTQNGENKCEIPQETLPSQYNNDFHVSLPPSPSPPPNPYPYPHPHISYHALETKAPPATEFSVQDEVRTRDYEEYEGDGGETMSIPAGLNLDSRTIRTLHSASHSPPITASSLKTLDLNHIIGDIRLRVDLNFAYDLRFRRFNGENYGENKRAERDYYHAVAAEIFIYSFNSMHQSEQRQTSPDRYDYNSRRDICLLKQRRSTKTTASVSNKFEPRLPTMLETLKDILTTLVPECDQQSVKQNLDVPFLMQQVQRGVLDLVKLTTWLATLLKSHCAPIRDGWVDKMVNRIGEGCSNHDVHKIAKGIKAMFRTLENMKLVNIPLGDFLLYLLYVPSLIYTAQDVANHQIRTFKLILIDDTVRFMQNHYRKMIRNDCMFMRARTWYQDIRRQRSWFSLHFQREVMTSFEGMTVLFAGLFTLLDPLNASGDFPPTFEFEVEHLRNVRSDIQDLIGLEICSSLFELMATKFARNDSYLRNAKDELRCRIYAILYSDGHYPSYEENEDDISDNDDLDVSRNDSCYSGYNIRPDNNLSSAYYLHNNRWRNRIDQIALEIARTICSLDNSSSHSNNGYPDEDTLLLVERSLRSFFTTAGQRNRLRIQQELEAATIAHAKRYVRMTPLEMGNDHRSKHNPDYKRPGLPVFPDMDVIARRVAHIGVVHWKVWAPLLYVAESHGIFGPGNMYMMMPHTGQDPHPSYRMF